MMTAFPFVTAYDPPGTSEGALDPLGLYQIADQLAIQLVPAVRERMQRIRFLTAIAVGALLSEDIEHDPSKPEAHPALVWEWLVVESMARAAAGDAEIRGVPGIRVTRQAVEHYDYVDSRSYLKMPRIFGFHGVYKRLAVHLDIVTVHLTAGPNAERLADAWARDAGFASLSDARPVLDRWKEGVQRSVRENPARTRTNWKRSEWAELARAFPPTAAATRERDCLREMLLSSKRELGALPHLWKLQREFTSNESFREEALHERLESTAPEYAPLLRAIRSYEGFARRLQDAFDLLLAEGSRSGARGLDVTEAARDPDFQRCVDKLHERFEVALRDLNEINLLNSSPASVFTTRFTDFAEPLNPADVAQALCTHHESIQRGKSAAGKRAWFDRAGKTRVYVRHAYRRARREILPDHYLHDYRGWPIRRFCADLS